MDTPETNANTVSVPEQPVLPPQAEPEMQSQPNQQTETASRPVYAQSTTPPYPYQAFGNNGTVPPVPESQPKKSKKKLFIILGIVLGAVILMAAAAAVFVFLLLARTSYNTVSGNDYYAMSAAINTDGDAYLVLEDGFVIAIDGPVEKAGITADRQTVIVLTEDGTLYTTDKSQSNLTIIADEVSNFASVRDTGLLYLTEDDIAYRYTFQDGQSFELGEDIASVVSENALTVLYATDDGKLYVLTVDDDEAERVGSFDDYVYVDAVSDDGTVAVWTLTDDDDNNTPVIWNNGDKVTLSEYNTSSDNTIVTFTTDQKLMTVTGAYSDQMYILTLGDEGSVVKLHNTMGVSSVYTSEGKLGNQNSSNCDYMYVLVDNDDGDDLYCITQNGDKERMLSGVSSFRTVNGNLIYEDTDDNLYLCPLDGVDVGERNKIASDIDEYSVADNGKYIYYMKNVDADDDEGALYCYSVRDDESKRIVSDASCFAVDFTGYIIALSYYEIGTDGATVYYYLDMTEAGDSSTDYGTLYKWNYNTEESEKIASDVLEYSPSSGLNSGEIIGNCFTFERFESVSSSDIVHYDLYYYNGHEYEKIAQDFLDD